MLRDRRLIRIVLVFEMGKGNFVNYRFVSLMLILSEILEWIINRMVCEFLIKGSGGFRN